MSEANNQVNPSAQSNDSSAVQQPQQTLMFTSDPATQQWAITPEWYAFFENQLGIIETLKNYYNPDWDEQQAGAYGIYLSTLESYIAAVYNQQMFYYEEYEAWVNYATQTMPLGAQLYQKQFNYIKNIQLKEQKKLNKANKPAEQQPRQEPKKIPEKEEKVIVRSGDPQINIQKLFSTKYDGKYISTDFLAKQNANIVFIGHVDSGKSTLTGNIIKQLKEVDEQELARNKQEAKSNKMEAWQDAAISDVIPEERADGKTRQYAKLNFFLEKKRFTLFDAPGHKNYVPNMIMGACQADIAVLIISAKEGEFQSGFQKDGQTKEHAMLAKALGVTELIAVVTKMGTVNWDEKRFNYIKEAVGPFLQNNCGFNNVIFIPVESVQNQNVHTPYKGTWYDGPCFLNYLDSVKLPERKPMGPLRIPVIDKFKDMGQLFVYGKVESGTIIEDQTVTILPQRWQMVIREIFNAKDEKMPFACAGQNVKMRVKNIDEDQISRGDMICNNLNYCQESSELKANITILELPDEKKLLSSGYECIIHMHAIAAQVQISHVQSKLDKETGKAIKTTFLKAGQKGVCQLKIEKPICLEKYEFMPTLGRFTLRDEGKTIGYGEIIGLKPAKKLFDEQKEHLTGAKKEQQKNVEEVTKQLEKTELKDKTQ